ncbi:glutamine--fructose-6-phosphate transaminase (isomerizing) [Haladaptatus sp. CMAA 1911]|uniref:glutamine--fructose-6-phosphate transaminase (isomerizing) n=1 Tax=unclassified Haladaptatus TaxID=2622732 RepID=UPI0037552F7D
MCGIIGYTSRLNDAPAVLLNGLSNLEYRGYDSAGVALQDAPLKVIKKGGELDRLRTVMDDQVNMEYSLGIGHTRWSTHGAPSKQNAHPHVDCTNSIAVVHNGIIDNHQELKAELEAIGHVFASKTDTEVVPHLIEHYLKEDLDPMAAFRKTIARLEGSYALAAIFEEADVILAARWKSPLVLGLGDGRNFLASGVRAFREYTNKVVYLEDGEIARITPESVDVSDPMGEPVEKEVTTVEWDLSAAQKGEYEHYMLKEIHEQPHAIDQCVRSRILDSDCEVNLGVSMDVTDETRVEFVACGTSYYAAKYGSLLFRRSGIPSSAFLASEYVPANDSNENQIVVGVTQSGETADTLNALRIAKRQGAQTLAVTNVVDSSATRECDESLYIRAGPEIGVAATKTFATQLTALNLLACQVLDRQQSGSRQDAFDLITELRNLSNNVSRIVSGSNVEDVAQRYLESKSYFFIGRGLQYPVALEGALKMKEITYEHAEGFAAGELKHGPLALITDQTPIFVALTGDDEIATKTIANVEEIASRGAPVIVVTDGALDVPEYADQVISVPRTHPHLSPILVNTQFQLLSYHTARHLQRPIDKPRNLAKSVTVE